MQTRCAALTPLPFFFPPAKRLRLTPSFRARPLLAPPDPSQFAPDPLPNSSCPQGVLTPRVSPRHQVLADPPAIGGCSMVAAVRDDGGGQLAVEGAGEAGGGAHAGVLRAQRHGLRLHPRAHPRLRHRRALP
eukprot:1178893-Prorocentrum_minimum.AAC.3